MLAATRQPPSPEPEAPPESAPPEPPAPPGYDLPPPPAKPTSFDAPPPPPSDWLPGAPLFGRGAETGTGRAGRRPKARRNRAGFGCGTVIVLVIFAGIGAAILGVVKAASGVASGIVDTFDAGEDIDAEPLELGRPVDRHLGSDDTAIHPLRGIEGRVTITVDGHDDFDPLLRIVDADGDVLGENDDADGLDSRLALILTASEELQVQVREYSGDGGDYTVLVVRGDETVGITPIEGGRLAIRTPVAGNVGRDQAAAYDFTGEGREVVVTVQGLDGFDPVVRVLDGAGTELGRNDDSSDPDDGRYDSLLPIVVPGATTVTVEVTGFNGAPGAYRLLVE